MTFFNAAGDTAVPAAGTAEGTVTVRGTTTASTPVTIVETGATATANAAGAYEFADVPVVVGSNTFTVKAGTGAATSQATGTVTGTATAATPTAPTVNFFDSTGATAVPAAGTAEGTAVIKGTTSADATLTLVETGDTTVADAAGAYSFTDVPIVVGTNSYTVQATGADGTTRQTTKTVTGTATASTPTAPTVLLFNAAGDTALTGGATSEATATVRGVTSPDAIVTLNGTADTTVADTAGAYEFTGVPVTAGATRSPSGPPATTARPAWRRPPSPVRPPPPPETFPSRRR